MLMVFRIIFFFIEFSLVLYQIKLDSKLLLVLHNAIGRDSQTDFILIFHSSSFHSILGIKMPHTTKKEKKTTNKQKKNSKTYEFWLAKFQSPSERFYFNFSVCSWWFKECVSYVCVCVFFISPLSSKFVLINLFMSSELTFSRSNIFMFHLFSSSL